MSTLPNVVSAGVAWPPAGTARINSAHGHRLDQAIAALAALSRFCFDRWRAARHAERDRVLLAGLSNRQLRDIGLDPCEVRHSAAGRVDVWERPERATDRR